MNIINKMGVTQEELTENVLSQLSSEPELQDENISVEIEGEELTLFGEVHSVDKKWLAEQIAYDVLGIIRVNNKLNVLRDA